MSEVEPHCGVLLANLGTPDAPTPAALRRYLGEFLADPRVIELPRWLWWLILHGVILRIRPARSARAYARVWTEQGSPLMRYSAALRDRLREELGEACPVELGMRYGNPPIAGALDALRNAGCTQIAVLPLYPQYSATTSASVYDAIGDALRQRRDLPTVTLIRDYHTNELYLDALTTSIEQHWRNNERPQRLVFSFHGIPQRYADAGDPYPQECKATARAVADRLGLGDEQWQLCFQSRFGREPWLQPYLDKTLAELPQHGVRSVDVICPGFAADCLETLEEVDMENRETFLEAGGESFSYIAALNDSTAHAQALASVIRQYLPRSSASEIDHA